MVAAGRAHGECEAGAVCAGSVVALCGEEGQLGFASVVSLHGCEGSCDGLPSIMTKMVYFSRRIKQGCVTYFCRLRFLV